MTWDGDCWRPGDVPTRGLMPLTPLPGSGARPAGDARRLTGDHFDQAAWPSALSDLEPAASPCGPPCPHGPQRPVGERPAAPETLVVADVPLHWLPQDLPALATVQTLSLSGHVFFEAPALRPLGRLSALTRLDLSHNLLATLPRELSALSRLEDLDLAANALRAVPPVVMAIPSLRRLSLAMNRLTDLPLPSTPPWPRLSKLKLGGNALAAVPAALITLTALEQLYLDDNRLTDLLPDLAAMPRLALVYAPHNPYPAWPTLVSAPVGRAPLSITKVGPCAGAGRLVLWESPSPGPHLQVVTSPLPVAHGHRRPAFAQAFGPLRQTGGAGAHFALRWAPGQLERLCAPARPDPVAALGGPHET